MQTTTIPESLVRGFEDIVCAHLRGETAVADIQIDGVKFVLKGEKTYDKKELPTLVLLQAGSTFSEPIIDPTALQSFSKHAENLIKDQINFKTVLRPNWETYTHIWSLS